MDTGSIVSFLGFMGALIGGYAYLPQITHLIKESCSAGISSKAFGLWTLSSTLIFINAIYIASPVFIFLSVIQLAASFTILLLSVRNKNHICTSHLRGENPLA